MRRFTDDIFEFSVALARAHAYEITGDERHLGLTDDCGAHHADRARRDADNGDLVDAAMRDILRGDFDSFAVKLAEQAGVVAMAKVTG